jgi:hypothetical protein
MTVKASIQTGTSVTIGGGGSPTIAYGTGAPSGSKATGASTSASGTPVVGSQYIRTDGTAGSRIYWYYGGSWVAQTSP